MKKLFSLTVEVCFILALSTVSCKKTTEDELVGKWNVLSDKVTYYENNVKMDEETETYQPGDMCYEFLADGTGKQYEHGELSGTFIWKRNGDLLTLSFDATVDAEYTLNGNSLTIKATIEETYDSVVYKMVMEIVFSRA